MENTPMICADQVRFRYDDQKDVWAVKGAGMTVKKGEFVAVLGANGCGKSTLAKHFNAILRPESGTVTVEGIPTTDEARLYDIRQRVGMVFQNPDNQIVATVVEEDVAFALENLGVPPEEIRRRVDWLVLVESTAMLDPRGREMVMSTIGHLIRDFGITVVAITHYMEEAAQADRVLVMSEGRVVMEGTPQQVFSQADKLHSLHLDVPQAVELRDELVKAGVPMPEGIIDEGS